MATARVTAAAQRDIDAQTQPKVSEPLTMTEAVRDALRAEFHPAQIGKLPQLISRGDTDKAKCEPGSRVSADGYHCGGWHARSIHLDYVGHAATTDRLLAVDPSWSWRPFTQEEVLALPPAYREAGLWIMLTIAGVSRPGFGDSGGKPGGNGVKEAIGDAIRNGAMRFGVALDLWSKEDLHRQSAALDEPATDGAPPPPPHEPSPQELLTAARWRAWEAYKAVEGPETPTEAFPPAYEQWCAQPFVDATAADFDRYAAHLKGQAS